MLVPIALIVLVLLAAVIGFGVHMKRRVSDRSDS
jgi:hypothetical protein